MANPAPYTVKTQNPKTLHQAHLAVALSTDGGLTWSHVRDLEEEQDEDLEYSYPSIVQVRVLLQCY